MAKKRSTSNSPDGIIAPCPKVALLVETSRGYGRRLLRGIVRYSRLHGPWSFYITPGDFEQALPHMHQWGGAGIIARVETEQVAQSILAAKIPTIIVDADPRVVDKIPELAEFSEVASGSEGAALLAAEHLLERGFEYFAFVGIRNRVW